MNSNGLIALDIDGTITVEHHDISPLIVSFLSSLANKGWQFIFVTGRTFQWGYEVLRHLPFSYSFAVQNGAIIIEMPSRKILMKKYLDKTIFPTMEAICKDEDSDFVIYGGYEFQDRCFFRPEHFEKKMLHYLKRRVETLKEVWEPLNSLDELPLAEFSSIKCFGDYNSAQRIAAKMEQKLSLHSPLIRDPFSDKYYIAQATHPLVNKGQAVLDLKSLLKIKGPIIAAGDDNNDRPMIAIADVKVVMETAPQEMKSDADIIAPPAAINGIIQGLTEAIHFYDNNKSIGKP
jgi:Cof subfamily protein (haloacid dehalogenase superfamily)